MKLLRLTAAILTFLCAAIPSATLAKDTRDIVANCLNVGQPLAAVSACSAAIGDPRWTGAAAAWAYNNRGLAHAASGNFLAAIEDYSLAIALRDDFAPAFSNRGNAHAALGDMLMALADHDRAIELDPTYVSAWHNRGVDNEELGNARTALDDYRKALSLNAEHGGSRIGLATANCRLGRTKASSAARLDAINRGHIDPAEFQRTLKRAGHYNGEIDGKFGKASRAALRAWTRAGCLPVR